MKREIKFRQAIFHPVTKKFLRWHYWGLIEGAFVGIDTGWYNPTKAIGNSYQFMCSKDKNGKEIYEGDIVKSKQGLITTVEWDDDIDCDRYWRHATGLMINFEDGGVDDAEPIAIEVIGNIWENEELLK